MINHTKPLPQQRRVFHNIDKLPGYLQLKPTHVKHIASNTLSNPELGVDENNGARSTFQDDDPSSYPGTILFYTLWKCK